MFKLGCVLISKQVNECGIEFEQIAKMLQQHLKGVWEHMSDKDIGLNQMNLRCKGTLVSSYEISNKNIYLITHSKHTQTDVLTEDEFCSLNQ